MAQTTNENTNATMEQILAAINGVNDKIDGMQKDIESLKDDLKETKKRQDKVDERFEKMEKAIDEALEEAKAAEQPAPEPEKESVKDKIKGNLKFIIPAGVVLTAVGGAVAYAVYKNKCSASYVEVEGVDSGDVIDM